MLTGEQNERLTRVGPGTPCGALLRRYWQALCPAGELAGAQRKKRVRILGEDLVVYRKDDGSFAAVAEQCPHRNASLYFGFIEPDGIRCCYHGWKYDAVSGACTERPFEPKGAHAGIRLRTYPVEALSGLLFAYMGPDPERAPLLPRWDVLARTDRPKTIDVLPVHHCNWLQIQENTADSVHTYYLHGHLSQVLNLPSLDRGAYFYRPIVSYDFAISEWGVEKTIVYGGERPEIEIRPPLLFPNILRVPAGPTETLHFRVPINDERTRVIMVTLQAAGSAEVTNDADVTFTVAGDPPGHSIDTADLSTFLMQDRVVWETQGAVADRSRETLGASDRGIVLFRRMLAEQIDLVEAGGDPTIAVVRDPARNQCIEFENQSRPWTASDRAAV